MGKTGSMAETSLEFDSQWVTLNWRTYLRLDGTSLFTNILWAPEQGVNLQQKRCYVFTESLQCFCWAHIFSAAPSYFSATCGHETKFQPVEWGQKLKMTLSDPCEIICFLCPFHWWPWEPRAGDGNLTRWRLLVPEWLWSSSSTISHWTKTKISGLKQAFTVLNLQGLRITCYNR